MKAQLLIYLLVCEFNSCLSALDPAENPGESETSSTEIGTGLNETIIANSTFASEDISKKTTQLQYHANPQDLRHNATTTPVIIPEELHILEFRDSNPLVSTTPMPREDQNQGSDNTGTQTVIEETAEIFNDIFGSFGSQEKTASFNHTSCPEFMINLYRTVTDQSGVTRARHPYNADVVKAVMEQGKAAGGVDDHFFFNVSTLDSSESLLEAELHIYRRRTPHDQLHPSLYLTPFYILSLYQITDTNPRLLAIPDLHKLLGVHYVPALGSGWEVFNVTQIVKEWLDGAPNKGLLLAAASLGGDQVPVKFSRRWDVETGDHSSSKQPVLVLFTKNEKYKLLQQPRNQVATITVHQPLPTLAEHDDDQMENYIPGTDETGNPRFHHSHLHKLQFPSIFSRSRRSKNGTEQTMSSEGLEVCGKSDLVVQLKALGLSSWVIAPRSFNAYMCVGNCSFPIKPKKRGTNHAAIQSILQKLNSNSGIPTPCCVPKSLLPISLLYYQDEDNVILKQYTEIIAESCECQ